MTGTINLDNAFYPDLSQRQAVIAGGTGDVGEGIVRAWLKTGAQVIVPTRTDGRAEQFKDVLSDLGQPENLHIVTGHYGSFDDAQALAARITGQYGQVTDVVASIGGWWQGKPLWDVSPEEWQRYFVDMTTAHAAMARAWIPHLPQTGSYQLILGGSAVEPVPGASIISMQQAALLMMRRVLSVEAGESNRIAAQILGPVVTRARKRIDPDWVTNEEVGLVSAGIAADPAVTDADYVSYNKAQMLETLQKLAVYPG
ncbi:3-oxoacyl-[acyl-carrier protein] reductase [Lutimaribacter pacificus]|uniref:3-oxoacyl-[acyl-carrier protein] reductase n=1 Tax=Lutimaribacter pacificus TaxID=391948 RepID=A0A1H0HML6_9RHOB|nr:SDR family oxidoreductase [Lutimaribacter pacificus]SDO20081.1 3-oxoacyl-[acyl-carrier protein] reductase [Lutimaribacter pacificus]SHK34319.1 3-oxoacyl-[acyl-carrier protein] reductase [Lutimaribacter pacificus]